MSTTKALQRLMEGNERFVNQQPAPKDFHKQISETATGQKPFAAVLTCIDSRVSPELIFDTGIGDIFTARVAGNVVNEDVLGSLEFAGKVTGSELILVLGHTNCGAVKSAINEVEMGNITPMLSKIQPAIDKVKAAGVKADELEEKVIHANVHEMIGRIRQESAILNQLEQDGMIQIAGALYDVSTGLVRLLSDQT